MVLMIMTLKWGQEGRERSERGPGAERARVNWMGGRVARTADVGPVPMVDLGRAAGSLGGAHHRDAFAYEPPTN